MLRAVRLAASARHARALRGHPWAYRAEVEVVGPSVPDGDAVELTDTRGYSLGAGIWNARSQIVWRRFASRPEPLDAEGLARRLAASVARRPAAAFGRLVYAEADALPGLIIDRFGPLLSVQANTLGMDRRLPAILDWLRKNLSPEEIVLRLDAPARELEGLPLRVATASGKPLKPRRLEHAGLSWEVDLLGGQKTGLYLDQFPQHARIASLAKGRRMLDAFCNQGGFALAAAKAGASEVVGVDQSEDAVAAGRANAEANGLPGVLFEIGNVFDWLRDRADERFDLIVLDPPPFARSKEAVEGALRGYKDLTLRALKMLNPGGILATYSCSQRVTESLFQEVTEAAAADARRAVRVIERVGQPADHPEMLNFPEGRYLKGLVLEAV
jgi:23S rRNA (cytosine1962-C5)-methyltransferase